MRLRNLSSSIFSLCKILYAIGISLNCSLIQLLVPALQYVEYPTDVGKKDKMFPLKDKPQICKLLLTHMMDLLLVTYR